MYGGTRDNPPLGGTIPPKSGWLDSVFVFMFVNLYFRSIFCVHLSSILAPSFKHIMIIGISISVIVVLVASLAINLVYMYSSSFNYLLWITHTHTHTYMYRVTSVDRRQSA